MDGLGESFLRRSRGGARSATGQDRLGEIVYWARSAGRDRAAATSDGEIGGFRWRDRLGEIKTVRDRRLQMARSAASDGEIGWEREGKKK
ncbi:hypothetical protein SO802_027262 [Lithocarpus litseifolius]|uniref:Uncharacterized protein n=1 Tax=Lithocarpus litseifolius TaxID=425828 RepID=A0AAW2C2D9_9ROSI